MRPFQIRSLGLAGRVCKRSNIDGFWLVPGPLSADGVLLRFASASAGTSFLPSFQRVVRRWLQSRGQLRWPAAASSP
jgi:hypothetical protein